MTPISERDKRMNTHDAAWMLYDAERMENERLQAENAALKEQVAQLEAKNAMQHIVLEDYGVTHDQQQETIAQQAEQHAFAL